MGCCYKDSICTNTVHVDADSRLQIIHMNVSIFCNQIDDTMLCSNLPPGKKKSLILTEQKKACVLHLQA